MVAVGVWLFVVGACDLLRAARDTTSLVRRGLIAVIGVLLLLFFGLLTGMEGTEWPGLGLGWIVTFLVWLLGSSAALQRGSTLPRVLAFVGLFGGLAVTVAGGGVLQGGSQMPPWLDGTLLGQASPDRLLLFAGMVLFQLSSANVVVRLILDAVGVPATTNEKRLKGGRLLGPMERLFLIGLGLAGQLTAAAVVVAAKGLLRFPELQRGVEAEGPSDVTEYFLIGSFASWLIALGGLALLGAAGFSAMLYNG
jgi:hypothetical protein